MDKIDKKVFIDNIKLANTVLQQQYLMINQIKEIIDNVNTLYGNDSTFTDELAEIRSNVTSVEETLQNSINAVDSRLDDINDALGKRVLDLENYNTNKVIPITNNIQGKENKITPYQDSQIDLGSRTKKFNSIYSNAIRAYKYTIGNEDKPDNEWITICRFINDKIHFGPYEASDLLETSFRYGKSGLYINEGGFFNIKARLSNNVKASYYNDNFIQTAILANIDILEVSKKNKNVYLRIPNLDANVAQGKEWFGHMYIMYGNEYVNDYKTDFNYLIDIRKNFISSRIPLHLTDAEGNDLISMYSDNGNITCQEIYSNVTDSHYLQSTHIIYIPTSATKYDATTLQTLVQRGEVVDEHNRIYHLSMCDTAPYGSNEKVKQLTTNAVFINIHYDTDNTIILNKFTIDNNGNVTHSQIELMAG